MRTRRSGPFPHSAFHGQTPDEMYFGRGDGIAERLAAERGIARRQRMETNRAQRCAACA
jgi:putative transposase